MAKDKETKVEEVKETLVSLEMTEAEKAEYVKFKADQLEEKSKALSAADEVTIQTTNDHLVNGVRYLAGIPNKVRRDIAEALMVQDQRATDSYYSQFISNNKTIAMGMDGRAKITNTNGKIG